MLLEGLPISPGYAKGSAVVHESELEPSIELKHRTISRLEVKLECARLSSALGRYMMELKLVEQAALGDPRLADSMRMLSAQAIMAKEIASLVKMHIGFESVSVERALAAVTNKLIRDMERLDNEYFREREQDVRDVAFRMSQQLAEAAPWTNKPLPPRSIIVARELLPSETIELAKSGAVAIVTDWGGRFSHSAIVARSMGIPAITGISNGILRVQSGASLLVDGVAGTLVAGPTKLEEASFDERKRKYEHRVTSCDFTGRLPCVTQDGLEVALLANIGLPEEVSSVVDHNLAGVGLFRTELLFLESHESPTLQAQTEAYDHIARSLDDLPLVIRVFDFGGDKLPPFLLTQGPESLSSLQLRGLRYSLSERDILDTQLQAILQVVQTADVRLLFPMVIGRDDFARAIARVDFLIKQLGLLRRPAIGAMIETPAALFALDEIIELADFVAIGTNDLTQYMLAADRDLAKGTDDCTIIHPAVLRAIRQVVEVANERKCPVCVCGEEAGDPDVACLLVGLNIRELSLTPRRAAAVRNAIRGINYQHAKEVASQACRCRTPHEVRNLLAQLRSSQVMSDPIQLVVAADD